MKKITDGDIGRDPTLLAMAITQSLDDRDRPRDERARSEQQPIEYYVDKEYLDDQYIGPILRAAWAHGRACILQDMVNIFNAERQVQRSITEHGSKDAFVEAYQKRMRAERVGAAQRVRTA